LLAIAAGAIAVAIRNRAWRTALIVLLLGGLAAASLLPYAPMFVRMRAWTFLVHYPCDFSWLWKRASEVTGSPHPWTTWLWAGLFLGAIGPVIGAGFLRKRPLPAPVLFAAVSLAVGVAVYAGFLRALNYYTQPWYYITIVAFAACTIDLVFGGWSESLILRFGRPLLALALLCSTALAAWKEMPTRHTNVDLLAAQLQGLTRSGDVVLVPRWECAIPFSRYYHGAGDIVTLPPMEDHHRLHRYDLLLAQMKTNDAHAPVLVRIEEALRSGHRVYFAGELSFPDPAVELPPLRPIYQDATGKWHGSGHTTLWPLYTGQFLRAHVQRIGKIDVRVADDQEVQHFEDLEAGVLEGWK
jgi:hypothetical protein